MRVEIDIDQRRWAVNMKVETDIDQRRWAVILWFSGDFWYFEMIENILLMVVIFSKLYLHIIIYKEWHKSMEVLRVSDSILCRNQIEGYPWGHRRVVFFCLIVFCCVTGSVGSWPYPWIPFRSGSGYGTARIHQLGIYRQSRGCSQVLEVYTATL